ncbi:MAG TPA: PadR family transcriptional regulator [Thermoleophilaceae bacterium]|nr:PadR family transcriptional regulator [Thermoleophilaceae bacterium]
MAKLSTKHVVLGLMIERPGYGYGLQQQFSDRLGFLGLAESSVYKTIERLEADGWVEAMGSRRPDSHHRATQRVLYRATPEGVVQFKRWMAQPSDRAIVRDELHAKLALSNPTDLPDLLRTAEAQSRECLAELAAIGGRSIPVSADLPWGMVATALVDDFKARWLEALVDWLDQMCRVIEERMAQGAVDAS